MALYKFAYYPPFAERIDEVFILLYVFLFGQRFLSNPGADSRHILHAGVAWVGTCLLPFWGVGGPRRTEKGANEIFVTMGVNGEFLHFGGF